MLAIWATGGSLRQPFLPHSRASDRPGLGSGSQAHAQCSQRPLSSRLLTRLTNEPISSLPLAPGDEVNSPSSPLMGPRGRMWSSNGAALLACAPTLGGIWRTFSGRVMKHTDIHRLAFIDWLDEVFVSWKTVGSTTSRTEILQMDRLAKKETIGMLDIRRCKHAHHLHHPYKASVNFTYSVINCAVGYIPLHQFAWQGSDCPEDYPSMQDPGNLWCLTSALMQPKICVTGC